ncbi:MAG: hypothetical protein ACI3YK_05810 [Eubacteriales bacterium]
MQFTFWLGVLFFILSMLLSLLYFIGSFFKHVGISSFGVIPVLFILICPIVLLILELAMYHYAPHVWGIAYIFIVLNIYLLVLQYFLLLGSTVFTKNHIYRLTASLTFRKYSYSDVIGYVMKYSSGTVIRKFGVSKVRTYDTEVYFADQQYAHFSTNKPDAGKVACIKKLLEAHHCPKNGRIYRSAR